MKTSAYILIFALLVIMVVFSILWSNGENPGEKEGRKNPAANSDDRPGRSMPLLAAADPEPPDRDADDTPPSHAPETTAEPEELFVAPQPSRPVEAAAAEPVAYHRVRRGENYTGLAVKFYGCTRNGAHPYAMHIAAANPDKDANRLTCNSTIAIPALSPELRRRLGGSPVPVSAPEPETRDTPAPPRTGPNLGAYRIYIVQQGDSLWEIARVQLGDALESETLFELNKELGLMQDKDDLKKGQKIVLGRK